MFPYHCSCHHNMSCHRYHVMSCHVYRMSYHVICHVISHVIMSYHVISCHVMLYLYHIISCHIISCHIISHILWWPVISCFIMQRHETEATHYFRVSHLLTKLPTLTSPELLHKSWHRVTITTTLPTPAPLPTHLHLPVGPLGVSNISMV
jgi:hypothetical protein